MMILSRLRSRSWSASSNAAKDSDADVVESRDMVLSARCAVLDVAKRRTRDGPAAIEEQRQQNNNNNKTTKQIGKQEKSKKRKEENENKQKTENGNVLAHCK